METVQANLAVFSYAWAPSQFMSFLCRARAGFSCSMDKPFYGWQQNHTGAGWYSQQAVCFSVSISLRSLKYLLGFCFANRKWWSSLFQVFYRVSSAFELSVITGKGLKTTGKQNINAIFLCIRIFNNDNNKHICIYLNTRGEEYLQLFARSLCFKNAVRQ